MIAIDQKTKDFYLSMGYSDTQIQIAYTHSKQSGIDILDALNMNQEPVAPPPAKQNELSSQTASYAYRNNLSFLTPWKRVKHNDYEILFSRNNKHQSSSTKTELREENYPVGLLNVSNCCYLNSLLQCYFLMNDFKTAIFTAEPLANLEQTLAH